MLLQKLLQSHFQKNFIFLTKNDKKIQQNILLQKHLKNNFAVITKFKRCGNGWFSIF